MQGTISDINHKQHSCRLQRNPLAHDHRHPPRGLKLSLSASASLHTADSGEAGALSDVGEHTAATSTSNTSNRPLLPSIAVITPTSPAAVTPQTASRRTRSHSEAGLDEQEHEGSHTPQSAYTPSTSTVAALPAPGVNHQLSPASALLPSSEARATVQHRVKRRRGNDNTNIQRSYHSLTMQPGEYRNNGPSNGASATDQHATPSTSKMSNTIYPGSQIGREELVRLTLQCLQDAGYQ